MHGNMRYNFSINFKDMVNSSIINTVSNIIKTSLSDSNQVNVTQTANIITISEASHNKNYTIDTRTLNIHDNDLDNNLRRDIATIFGSVTNVDPDTERRWIVKFKHNVDVSALEYPENIKIQQKYNHIYHGAFCHATERQIIDWVQHGIIESYHPDHMVSITATQGRQIYAQNDISEMAQPVQPYIQRIGADHSSQKSGDGTGSMANRSDINLFIVDTGIYTHVDLNVVAGMNFTTSNSAAWLDDNGHGTHVAGIAAALDNNIGVVGVAPGAPLWAIKVLDANGNGWTSTIITALNWILGNRGIGWGGYGIVNMSLGGPISQPLDDAVQQLINNGIVVCVAAGNETQNAANVSPARAPNAITVGAVMPNPTYNTLASYSNYGQVVDILAPGSNILSTYLNNGYAILSGTSMATPVITGTVALMVSTVFVGTPNNAGFVGNVRNTLLYVSSPLSYPNYDATVTPNPRIILSTAAINAGTTDINVRSGTY